VLLGAWEPVEHEPVLAHRPVTGASLIIAIVNSWDEPAGTP